MNRLVSHIEFLLHEHNCVIIPNLGGFVINKVHSRRDGIAMFYPPSCELVFNRELTYNDGLLAESYMNTYGLSFEATTWKIEEDVTELKKQLRDSHFVDLGRLGSFTLLDNDRYTYKPGEFVRPAYFGITRSRLKPLIQMKKPQVAVPVSEGKSKHKRFRVAGMVATAAVVLALTVFILPMSDNVIGRQLAQISYETEWLLPKSKQEVSYKSEINEEETLAVTNESVASEDIDIPPTADVGEVIDDSLPRYYIVMGVFEIKSGAHKMINILKDEGFSDTDWIKRPGRYDVYVASFIDEANAKEYLYTVHEEFPSHSDAWILKR